ncbi:MAG: helix-turn-helix domain-containing protein [Planctomycetes bacterium]|nr:helix-turn-helix domain-containing protein [Planctomycetota bacterium]
MPYPHQFIKLTPEEKKKVSFWLERYALIGRYNKRRRLQILYLSDQQIGFKRIAQRLKYHYDTVRWNIYLYRKQGLKPFIPE